MTSTQVCAYVQTGAVLGAAMRGGGGAALKTLRTKRPKVGPEPPKGGGDTRKNTVSQPRKWGFRVQMRLSLCFAADGLLGL